MNKRASTDSVTHHCSQKVKSELNTLLSQLAPTGRKSLPGPLQLVTLATYTQPKPKKLTDKKHERTLMNEETMW